MDCKEILLLAFLGLVDLSPGMSIAMKDPFPAKLLVLNRNITCEESSVDIVFGYTLYTCGNISVDGVKVFHANNDYKEKEITPEVAERTGFSVKIVNNNNLCPDCPCGSYTAEPNDVVALCSAIMISHGIEQEVLSAYTPNPICTQKGAKEPRVKFYLDNKQAKWLNVEANSGYIGKLQCMVDKKG